MVLNIIYYSVGIDREGLLVSPEIISFNKENYYQPYICCQ